MKESAPQTQAEVESFDMEQAKQWYREQIELAQLRAELSKAQADAVSHEARRIQAMALIAQMSAQPSEEQPDENPATAEKQTPKV